VRLMKLGFSTRLDYVEVHAKYASGLPEWAAQLPARELVQALALASGVPATDLRFGTTKLFCRASRGSFLGRLMGGGGGADALDTALDASASLPEVRALPRRTTSGSLIASDDI
jgi:hypothetical protein